MWLLVIVGCVLFTVACKCCLLLLVVNCCCLMLSGVVVHCSLFVVICRPLLSFDVVTAVVCCVLFDVIRRLSLFVAWRWLLIVVVDCRSSFVVCCC